MELSIGISVVPIIFLVRTTVVPSITLIRTTVMVLFLIGSAGYSRDMKWRKLYVGLVIIGTIAVFGNYSFTYHSTGSSLSKSTCHRDCHRDKHNTTDAPTDLDKKQMDTTGNTVSKSDFTVKRNRTTRKIVFRKHSNSSTKMQDYYRSPYIIANTEKCKGNVHFVVMVNSGVNYLQRRTTLRNTWADQKVFNKNEMRVVFLLGKTEKPAIQNMVLKEQDTFGDIVQGSFIDHYHNLTYKGMLGFRWVLEYCPNARHVVKVDDDVILDVFRLMNMLSADRVQKMSDTLWCHKRKGTTIERSGRWKLEADIFPGMKKYPFPDCEGPIVIIPAVNIQYLYSTASTVDFIWIDDILLFSLVPYMVGLELRSLDKDISWNSHDLIKCSQKQKARKCRIGYLAIIMTWSNNTAIVIKDVWTQSMTKETYKIWPILLKSSKSYVNTYGNKGYISSKLKFLH